MLAELGGNLEDSSMTLLRGHFAWTLIVSGPDATAVQQGLAALTADGLVISVLAVPQEQAGVEPGATYVLSVHGGDRPGIVSEMTSVVAAAGGNIVDLTTRLAGDLYIVIAEVVIPISADIAQLERALHSAAARVGVGVTLRPEDTDLL